MKKVSIWNIFLITALIVSFVAFIYQIKEAFFHTPKYKVGDCMAYVYDANEFEPKHLSPLIYKILKVGKSDYLYVDEYSNGPTYGNYLRETNAIQNVDRYYEKVECK